MRKDTLAAGARSATFAGGVGDENDIFRNVSNEPRVDIEVDTTPVPIKRKKFIPLDDILLVRQVEAKSPSGLLVLTETEKERPAEGRVLEAGKNSAGISAGDDVVFGKYSGTQFKLNGEILLLMRVDEVQGKIVAEDTTEQSFGEPGCHIGRA